MKNIDVRQTIARKRLRYYELAAELKINPCTLSRWFQTELPEDKKQRILEIVENYQY